MNELIILEKLSKYFGQGEARVSALKDVNLKIKEREWLAIMGPSGSGKSTLLNILSLMDEPSAGEYFLDGLRVSELNEEEKIKIRREKIGLIFQQFHLIPYLNALENVMLAQFYHSAVDENDARFVLERVGLAHRLNHLPSQLSGGEQQRVCIARALINNPPILLADEPTGNLDEANERIILELFQSLKNEGRSIILITHNPELANFADRCVRLHYGVLQ